MQGIGALGSRRKSSHLVRIGWSACILVVRSCRESKSGERVQQQTQKVWRFSGLVGRFYWRRNAESFLCCGFLVCFCVFVGVFLVFSVVVDLIGFILDQVNGLGSVSVFVWSCSSIYGRTWGSGFRVVVSVFF